MCVANEHVKSEGNGRGGKFSALVVMLLLVVSGCVSSPEKKDGEGQAKGIHLVENQSVDLSVRQDFDAATALLQEEKYEEAIVLLKKVLKGSQNNSAPHINIAKAYGMIGKMESAEESLKAALAINPKHPVAIHEYALLLRKTGRYIESRQQYEQLLALYPEFLPARRNLGILCDLYLNDVPCAIEQYEIYSTAFPADEDVKLWLTTLKQRGG